jgi:hypothetical protein
MLYIFKHAKERIKKLLKRNKKYSVYYNINSHSVNTILFLFLWYYYTIIIMYYFKYNLFFIPLIVVIILHGSNRF